MAIRYLTLSNGIPHAIENAQSIYDETTHIAAPVSTGTPITLPAGGTYTGDDLEVYLNSFRMEDVVDFNWLGSAPRTQISFTFDLVVGDDIRFRKDIV